MHYWFFCTFFVVSSAFAQLDSAQLLSNKIQAEILKKHIQILASTEMEGRETGYPGQKMAAQYIANQFKTFGIRPFQNTYFQSFPLVEIKAEEIKIKIQGKQLRFLQDFEHEKNFYNSSFSQKDGYYLGTRSIKYINKQDFKNKVVFILAKEKSHAKLPGKILAAQAKGAGAVFILVDRLTYSVHDAYYLQASQKLLEDSLEYRIPVIYASLPSLDTVCNESSASSFLTSIKKQRIKIDVESNCVKALSAENVFAYFPGQKQNDLVVLMAHYDHLGKKADKIFYGADDNATGTAALIEIANTLQKAQNQGMKFTRSVLVLLLAGEEKGLLGSKFYTKNPLFGLENTKAALNIDMIGRNDEQHLQDSNYVYIIGSDFISEDLHLINEKQNNKYVQLNLDYIYNTMNDPNRFYYRSDHYHFAEKGIPSIFYFSGVHEDYHRTSDTIDKINFKKVEKISQLVFLNAWQLLMQSEELTIKK